MARWADRDDFPARSGHRTLSARVGGFVASGHEYHRCRPRLTGDRPGHRPRPVDYDGIGIGDPPIGVGIASMRERSAELGGRLSVTEQNGGGTLVSARLPLSSPWEPPNDRHDPGSRRRRSHRIREGIEAVLTGRGGVRIVGSYGTAEAALAGLVTDPADVVLMDLGLPGLSGIEATRRLLVTAPTTRVLVLSMLDDTMSVRDAIDSGAAGYLAKTAGLDEILRGIHAVHNGQLLLGAPVARHLTGNRTGPVDDGYAPRERQVLALLAEAATTGQIAERLGIAQKTVRNLLSTLYLKLGVEDRGQAVLAARRLLKP